MPASSTATISSDVATGRRMKMRDGFMRACAWLLLRRRRCGRGRRRCRGRSRRGVAGPGRGRCTGRRRRAALPVAPAFATLAVAALTLRVRLLLLLRVALLRGDGLDLRAVAQLVRAVGDDALAGGETAFD